MAYIVNNQTIAADPEGFILNLNDWNEQVACAIAAQEGLTLTEEHWLIIHYLRDFYTEYNTTPAIRLLVKLLKEKVSVEKGSSIYLQTLFPGGAAKQSSKIAGLPKPVRCV